MQLEVTMVELLMEVPMVDPLLLEVLLQDLWEDLTQLIMVATPLEFPQLPMSQVVPQFTVVKLCKVDMLWYENDLY